LFFTLLYSHFGVRLGLFSFLHPLAKYNCCNEVKRLTLALQDTPEPIELAQIRAKYEELEKHNKTLKAELKSTSQREQDLKKIFDNYMVQVQSLINQKAIEVPGSKKPWWRF
jgi:hypothetical protein